MKLYHGSNVKIDNIDLFKGRPYKDFGQGFYLTDIHEQALRMANRVARIFHGTPEITIFDFDIEEAVKAGLKIKIFDSPSYEWPATITSISNLVSYSPSRTYSERISMPNKAEYITLHSLL